MIAIDFGTTNSSLAVMAEGDSEPRLRPVEFGEPESYNPGVIPSVVCECNTYACRHKKQTFGHEALRHGFELPHDSLLLQEMKLHFDRSTIDPPTLVEQKVIVALREEGGVLNPVSKTQRFIHYEGEVPLSPAQFVPATANLVRELTRRSNLNPREIDNVVLGIPASFSEKGVRRLRESIKRGVFGEQAGYERISLYHEPLAAARAYMQIATGSILVLDYGGGTLDIAVMTISESNRLEKEAIPCSGFPEGGSRIDKQILDHCLSKAGSSAKQWFEELPLKDKLKIKRTVEKAKISLSKEAEVSIEFPGTKFAIVPLTVADIALALQPTLARMVAKVTETVLKAVGSVENIDFVVMSGGTSLNKVVQRSVMAMFRHLPEDRFILPDPAHAQSVETCLCAVAKGLALLRRDGYAPIVLEDPL